jgi:anaerobic magnesium-protoporphyrin IX monomethyl ester cyclase
MKITFLMPATSEGFNTFNPDNPNWINHGLAILSAYAKKEGHKTSLIDFRRLSGWEEYSKIIKIENPDILAITAMTVDYPSAVKAAEICRKMSQNSKIIVGGPHATLVPGDFEKIKEIDYIFIGESEESFPKFLLDLNKNKKLPRMIYGKSPQNLDKIPFLDRELFGPYEAPIHISFQKPFLTLIDTRGCMYNCSFCQPAERNLHGSKIRHRSVDNFLEEIGFLRDKYKIKSFLIHDDNFLQDPKLLNEFIEKYPKKFNIPFACQGRADLIVKNEETLMRLSKIGLRLIMIGFESGSQRVLNLLRKGVTVKQNIQAARICKKYKILIWANYMVGIPTETKEEVIQTVKMIKQIKPDLYSPAILTPTPGTDLYKFCLENKTLLIKNYEDYARNSFAPKIKGLDYKFLSKSLEHSLPFKMRIRRKISKKIPSKIKTIINKIQRKMNL